MKGRILITARAFWVSGQAAREALEAAGCEVVNAPKAGPLPENELIDCLQGCVGVVASSDPYNAAVFAACPELRVVSRCGVGTDSVDFAAATEAGVVVTNTPGLMTDAVADYTFALMLGLARNLAPSDRLMRDGGWGEFTGVLVCGKTLGLVGFGQIGQGVARRAAGFGMTILAYDPPLRQAVALGQRSVVSGVEFTDLDDLLRRSDFVSVHAPATPETRGLFDAGRFALMKPTAYFINTARGSLVDEAALRAALEAGAIAGAALDVYSQEPLPADHPLRQAPRCLLTPHNAFNAVEAAAAMSLQSAENVLAALRGERPVSVCNPAVWDAPTLRIQPTGA
jgi:phosphoglycerate dehydrogenase-like enzyme